LHSFNFPNRSSIPEFNHIESLEKVQDFFYRNQFVVEYNLMTDSFSSDHHLFNYSTDQIIVVFAINQIIFVFAKFLPS